MTKKYLVANPYRESVSAIPFWDINCLPRVGGCSPVTIFHFFGFVLRKLGYRFTDAAFAEDDAPGSHRDLPYHLLGWPLVL